MFKSNIFIVCMLIVLLTACSKEKDRASLPDASVSFQLTAGKDSVEIPLSIWKDSAVVLDVKAALLGTTSSADHQVSFAIDTTKITDFRSRYGNANLLPATAYLFYKPNTVIPAGTSVSEAAQLNIGQQTKLIEYSTYVLPVVIKSVDGKIEGPATNKVLYYVLKTGKPQFISKAGWTIHDVSSVFNAFAAKNVIDGDVISTYWTSNITQKMPQWVSINFNREVKFTALTYYIPPLLGYPVQGGYPTSIQIETSMDGINWISKGVFAGKIEVDASNKSLNKQTFDLGGLVTARYLRFTSLASVKYAGTYEAIFISDITLVP